MPAKHFLHKISNNFFKFISESISNGTNEGSGI